MADSTVVFASLLDVPGAFDGLPDACPGADTPIKEAQADAEKPKGRPPKPVLTRELKFCGFLGENEMILQEIRYHNN